MSRLLLIFLLAAYVNSSAVPRVVQSFIDHELVPDEIPVAPEALLSVTFPSGVVVNEGEEVIRSQVQEVPTLTWDASPDQLYTVAMTDTDVPSREDPSIRAYLHWLVGNVPGTDLASGDTLAEFLGSGPSEGSGLHRYVFLVYQQPGPIDYEEASVLYASRENRPSFSIARFAENYNLGHPIAGNFYQCQFEG